jgi:hypothetical protein
MSTERHIQLSQFLSDSTRVYFCRGRQVFEFLKTLRTAIRASPAFNIHGRLFICYNVCTVQKILRRQEI